MTSERKFVTEAVKRVLLKEYLQSKTERAGFGGLDIQRTPMGTRVTLITERPGMVIGRKGRTIDELTLAIARDFKFDNPQIEVQEVANANINAKIMAQKLAEALERGWHFRRAGHSAVRRIMDSGAKGCLITIAGKLTGERHRTEKFVSGHIKHCGEPAEEFMLKGFAAAKKKSGVIGVQVQIMVPDAKLPDEINIFKVGDVKPGETEVDISKEAEPGSEEPKIEEAKEVVEPKKKSIKKEEFDAVSKIVDEEKAKIEKDIDEDIKIEKVEIEKTPSEKKIIKKIKKVKKKKDKIKVDDKIIDESKSDEKKDKIEKVDKIKKEPKSEKVVKEKIEKENKIKEVSTIEKDKIEKVEMDIKIKVEPTIEKDIIEKVEIENKIIEEPIKEETKIEKVEIENKIIEEPTKEETKIEKVEIENKIIEEPIKEETKIEKVGKDDIIKKETATDEDLKVNDNLNEIIKEEIKSKEKKEKKEKKETPTQEPENEVVEKT